MGYRKEEKEKTIFSNYHIWENDKFYLNYDLFNYNNYQKESF